MNVAIIGTMGEVAQKHKQAIRDMGWWFEGYDLYDNWKIIEGADIVSICTPSYLHHEMARFYGENGVKMLLEKPVSLTVADAKELLPYDISVCYQRRYDKQAIKIKKRKDRPSTVVFDVRVKRDPSYWDTWRSEPMYSGGGFLMNIGIHFMDLLTWWFGDNYEILSVKKQCFGMRVEEEFEAVIRFGKTTVFFRGSTRNTWRETNCRLLYGNEVIYYNEESASHFDIYKNLLTNPIPLRDTISSLQLVEDLYENS